MAKLNTNSNVYTILYACVLVIVVAFLLAFVASALKPTQDANVKLDTKKQILSALNIRDLDNAAAEAKYNEVITEGELNSPVLKANVDGEEKLIVAVKGAGLWGPIWGWISINKDGETVYGTFFNHESETAGLGARIKEQWFQDGFMGKKIYQDGNVALGVYKQGKAPASLSTDYYVDAVTGATLTSNGVNDMIQKCLTDNQGAIEAFKE
jgi:Na+-transporting NADH:ubiquinone oxidoreductase subunit C